VRAPSFFAVLALCALSADASFASGPRVVRLPGDSAAPLVTLVFQVRAGSARDPKGLEGLARLTAKMVLEGGFGDPDHPVTKERLADMTRAWGERATPKVFSAKEATTFSMTVPRDALVHYATDILMPMFTRPLFAEAELDRLRGEARENLRALRLEEIESFGLDALDALVHSGDGRAHPTIGTMRGLGAVETRDILGYFAAYYVPENTTLGVAGAGPEELRALEDAFSGLGRTDWPWVQGRALSEPVDDGVSKAVVIALPNAQSTGLHAAVPISVRRGHPDYWPLYVANVWFGTHRDSTGRLYGEIREKRGYNYGDYSYIEHFPGRPSALFPPPNAPRSSQYFSLWVRPVDHRYAPHLLRAIASEFERFAKGRLSDSECGAAKKKAKVLYLNLAETRGDLVGSAVDDAFYGLEKGWLPGYLESVEGVACDDVNDALRRHLEGKALDYLVVTDDGAAQAIADALIFPDAVYGKGPADYRIETEDSSEGSLWKISPKTLELLRRDAVWAHHDLGLTRGRVKVVEAEEVFETSEAIP